MSQSQEFIFDWKIQNFSMCFHTIGEPLNSPVFTTEKFGGSQWILQLFPKGYKHKDEGHVSLFLGQEINDLYTDTRTVSYDLAIVGINGRDIKSLRVDNHTFEKGMKWGFAWFINIDDLNDELKSYSEDVLVIRCRIFSSDKQIILPHFEAHTEIGVERASLVWELKLSDNSKDEINSKIEFPSESLYVIQLKVLGDKVRISVHQEQQENCEIFSKFIKGKLSIVATTGEIIQSVADDHLFQANKENDEWVFPIFNLNQVMNDDAFVLLCEFFASDRIVSESVVASDCNPTDLCPNLVKDMKDMLFNQVHTDVKLKTGKEVINAHKSVLAACSLVFSAMFEQDMIESQTGIVEISDVDSNTLKSFLEFIYTGKVEDFDYGMAKELLLVADKYQVMTLKEKCTSFLESVLSLKNVCEVLSMAELINHMHLKETAITFAVKNSTIVFKLPGWANLIQDNVKLAGEIFSNIAVNFSIIPKNIADLRR